MSPHGRMDFVSGECPGDAATSQGVVQGGKSLNESESITCPYCGDELPPRRRIHCGKPECKRAYNNARGQQWNAEHPGYRGQYKRKNVYSYERTCEECGETFRTKHHDGKYCSRRCHALAQRTTGVAMIPHPGPFTVLPVRHPARQRPRKKWAFVACTCVICGVSFITTNGLRHSACGSPSCKREHARVTRRNRSAYEYALRSGARAGVFTASQWAARLREYGGCCAYCGSDKRIEIEHVVPLARGGSNMIANIVPSCRACNQAKGVMTPDEWAASDCHRAASIDHSGWPTGHWSPEVSRRSAHQVLLGV